MGDRPNCDECFVLLSRQSVNSLPCLTTVQVLPEETSTAGRAIPGLLVQGRRLNTFCCSQGRFFISTLRKSRKYVGSCSAQHLNDFMV